jgi:hypothetical protein
MRSNKLSILFTVFKTLNYIEMVVLAVLAVVNFISRNYSNGGTYVGVLAFLAINYWLSQLLFESLVYCTKTCEEVERKEQLALEQEKALSLLAGAQGDAANDARSRTISAIRVLIKQGKKKEARELLNALYKSDKTLPYDDFHALAIEISNLPE